MSLILLTNDDGVQAPGLFALYRAVREVAETVVLAPEQNWSASGHVKTMHKPLRVTDVTLADGSPALASNGGPSDCVALALLGVLPRPPDLVISGINHGANLAQDMTYSGTVTAGLEALIAHVPAIAVSLDPRDDGSDSYDCAARFAARLALKMLASGCRDLMLNVNVPGLPCERINGVAITRLGTRVYRDRLIEREDPRGRKYYWIGGEVPSGVVEEGTDYAALQENKISVTPLQLDLTAHHALATLQAWDLRIEE